MLSGISLNLESVRLFWIALGNWNVATSQNQGKADYEEGGGHITERGGQGGLQLQSTGCCN